LDWRIIRRLLIITIRKADERGFFDHGWLLTRHTFSFAGYYDPAHMGWGPLRVINDDVVKPGEGFGTHGHSDMEIISYVLDGTLEHKDSMGHTEQLKYGGIQRMAAGTGVRHSEYNASETADVHFLQIWIEPDETGVKPEYEDFNIPLAEKRGKLKLIASPDSRNGSMKIHQDALVYCSVLEPGMETALTLDPLRRAWVHVATGECAVSGQPGRAGDGFGVSGEKAIFIRGVKTCELIVFDLP
jgi:redox-sensitive bicupin YhaK (pirin superfamily)